MTVAESPASLARALTPNSEPLIRLDNASRCFTLGGHDFWALRDVSVAIRAGESIAVTGRSGSGKSTLLNLVTGIDRPSDGGVYVGGTALHTMGESAVTAWRGRNVGIVFQFFQLLPTLTILDNVVIAMDFVGVVPARERGDRAAALLNRVGLAAHVGKHPGALSGGELQRAALARALANDPPIIVADEPTGNLDSRTSGAIVDLLLELVDQGKTLVLITHDAAIADRMSRVVAIADGSIASDSASR